MKKNKKSDNKKCKKCGGRTALVAGSFSYSADQEPYMNGIIEQAKVEYGDIYLHALQCDDCGEVQRFWID